MSYPVLDILVVTAWTLCKQVLRIVLGTQGNFCAYHCSQLFIQLQLFLKHSEQHPVVLPPVMRLMDTERNSTLLHVQALRRLSKHLKFRLVQHSLAASYPESLAMRLTELVFYNLLRVVLCPPGKENSLLLIQTSSQSSQN